MFILTMYGGQVAQNKPFDFKNEAISLNEIASFFYSYFFYFCTSNIYDMKLTCKKSLLILTICLVKIDLNRVRYILFV